MPKKKPLSLRCPICRTIVLRTQEDFPFCSDRCRTIDLGKWASGGYVISTRSTILSYSRTSPNNNQSRSEILTAIRRSNKLDPIEVFVLNYVPGYTIIVYTISV